jgi:type VI secretion system secreted protein VgrG
MSQKPKQTGRTAILKTPLGEDELLLTQFDAHEGLNALFEFNADCLSENGNIDFDQAIGHNCSVKLSRHKSKTRFFNGVLVEAEATLSDMAGPRKKTSLTPYRLVLRPWLWLLSQATDCRIFKNKSVKDIITDVFDKAGFSDYSFELSESYDPIEFCVQYRETNLSFVQRMMEAWGIYYYFTHSEDKHMLVMVDNMSKHKKVPGTPKIPFIEIEDRVSRTDEHLSQWIFGRRFRSGRTAVNDFDYIKPNADLLGKATNPGPYKYGALELYDFASKHIEKGKGDTIARNRLQSTQALDKRRHASGDAGTLFPGGLVELEKHSVGSENIEYLIVSASHHVTNEDYRTSGGGGSSQYNGRFEFQPKSVPFRAPLVTPRPLVFGPQTAFVVPKDKNNTSEEIDTDEHGRIFVRFHWDRDKQSSLPVRVSQIWSGKKWGGVVLPRIGQEVVVEFIEGDPDRPLVVGTVYNGEYKYPYELPANKTMSGVKSDSSKGGNGYNEFIFEDKKKSEKIRMHGEKDHEVVIRNSETWKIGEIFSPAAGSPSRETTIENGDDKVTVASGNQTIDVKKVMHLIAHEKIILECGNSKITLDATTMPHSIKIESFSITVDGKTEIKTKAPMTDINADAILTQVAGLIKIN